MSWEKGIHRIQVYYTSAVRKKKRKKDVVNEPKRTAVCSCSTWSVKHWQKPNGSLFVLSPSAWSVGS